MSRELEVVADLRSWADCIEADTVATDITVSYQRATLTGIAQSMRAAASEIERLRAERDDAHSVLASVTDSMAEDPGAARDMMDKSIKAIMETRAGHMEKFCAAFVTEVGSDHATQYALVEQRSADGLRVTWHFEPRQPIARAAHEGSAP